MANNQHIINGQFCFVIYCTIRIVFDEALLTQ